MKTIKLLSVTCLASGLIGCATQEHQSIAAAPVSQAGAVAQVPTGNLE